MRGSSNRARHRRHWSPATVASGAIPRASVGRRPRPVKRVVAIRYTTAMSDGTPDLAGIVAAELSLARAAVERTLGLFAGGATVPFIARYRKEATGGLDEVQIGRIQERHEYHADLEARRATILDSIAAQGKLGDDLRARIVVTRSKTELEDLYLPYKPKRRTKATIARERGLAPLADLVWAQALRLEQPREVLARPFVDAT